MRCYYCHSCALDSIGDTVMNTQEILPQGTYGQEEEMKEAINNADTGYRVTGWIRRESWGSTEASEMRPCCRG